MNEKKPIQPVTVIDFDMSFGHMIGFMVKLALASIPAMILITVCGAVLATLFTAITASLISQ